MLPCALLHARRSDDKLRLGVEFARLANIVDGEPRAMLADEAMGILATTRHPVLVDPFELTQLVRQGAADQRPLVDDLRAKRFGLVLVAEAPATTTEITEERWTAEMLGAVRDAYEPTGVLAGATLYRPKP